MSQPSDYVVVARRYRPQTFDELIGQEHVARGLKNAISADRVGHAYLFTGARGVGKTSAARILAKALNCRQGPTSTPCNACDVCESIALGDDVDVLEIDGASNRGIDEIRQLRQNVAVRPSRVRFKIYIIDEVHMLTREAFNALLKTLEEPPGHVKFIFATTEPQKVPITILSRCQRFDFAGIDTTAIEDRLAQIAEAEGITAEAEALALIARRAAGSMRDSQSLLEQLLAVAEGRITAADVNELLGTAPAIRVGEFVEHLLSGDAPAALALLDAAVGDGTDIGQFWEQLMGLVRDMMVAAAGAPASQFRHALPAQEEQVQRLAREQGVHRVLAVMQILETTSARMRTSIDPRTLAEMAAVRICNLPDLEDLAEVVGRLQGGNGDAAATAPVLPAGVGGAKKKPTDASSGCPSRATATAAVPPPPAPAANGEWSDAAAGRVWDEMRAGIDGMLADYLARAERITAASPGRLVAWFKYPLFKDACEQKENQQRIEEGLARAAGRAISSEFALLPSEDKPRRHKSRREILREVRERPFVKKAVELFGDETSEFRYMPGEAP